MLRSTLWLVALSLLLLGSSALCGPDTPPPKCGPGLEFRIEFRQPEWREQNFCQPNAAEQAKQCADRADALGYEVHLEDFKDRSRVAWRMVNWSAFATLYNSDRAQRVREWLESYGLETRLAEPPATPPVPDPRAVPPQAAPNPGIGPRKQFWPEQPGAPSGVPGANPIGPRPGDPAFGFPPPVPQGPKAGPFVPNVGPRPGDPAFGFPPPVPQGFNGPAPNGVPYRFQGPGFRPGDDPTMEGF